MKRFAKSAMKHSQQMFLSVLMVGLGLGSAGCMRPQIYSRPASLTGADFTGKKYYLGWGTISGDGDQEMANEVVYDVLHTHDIFTKRIGGDYIGTTLTDGYINAEAVQSAFESIKSKMGANDMYVQYSSGHGFQGGLGVGFYYDNLIDNILSLPAKEVVVFTMACFSGGLVDRLNERQAEWQDWKSKGRTLFVLTSSPANQSSSTGPGTDSAQPGPDGSAGSAFGYALWKALSGDADGYVDGVKDGFVSLEEVVAYTKAMTMEVGGHMPQVGGVYDPTLILNRVPSGSYLSSLSGGTEGLNEDQVRAAVAALDYQLMQPTGNAAAAH